MNLSEAKLRQLDAATTYRVYGHEVDFEEGASGTGATARRRWRLVSPCFCVHDSPDSPCPCMSDESRWWLRGEHVIDEGNAGRKDHDGQELQFFDVLVDSNVMVESLRPVSVGALKRLGDAVSPERVLEVASDSGAPASIAAPIPPIVVDIFKMVVAMVIHDMLGGPNLWELAEQAAKEAQKGKPPT